MNVSNEVNGKVMVPGTGKSQQLLAQFEDIRAFLPSIPASENCGMSTKLQNGEGVNVSYDEGKPKDTVDSEHCRVSDAKVGEGWCHGLVLRKLHQPQENLNFSSEAVK